MMSVPSDAVALLRDRLERIAAWRSTRGVDAVVLRRAENLAWITGGGDLRVSREGDAVADAVVTDAGLTLITNRIEAARLEREIAPPGTRFEVVPWHEPGARAKALARLTVDLRTANDGEYDLAELRLPLTSLECERFEYVGGLAARALTDAASALRPDMREYDVAAEVHLSARRAGLELPVVLVAGAERFARYRHPVVSDAAFGAYGLIVVCAQRFGLIASLTRTVAFGSVPDELAERLERVLRVEAAMLDATRPGVATNEVLRAARDAYAEVGEPDAWLDHHQGGPAGYTPREWLATPSETRPLLAGTPVAWNPSLPLAKSEDTFMVERDAPPRNLTWDDRWPSVTVAGRKRASVRVL
ncbi:M24 family metallopeptidase [soil metagenome]